MAVYDLSHRIVTGMPVFPGDPPVTVDPHAEIASDGYRVSSLRLGTHGGTHIDAPSHTEPGGKSIDQVPVEAFRFDARLVDCRGRDRRAAIGTDVLPEPPDSDLIVFQTGWDAFWGEDRYLDHPYLAPSVGEWCAEHGYCVAVDTLNPDPTPTGNAVKGEPAGLPVHRAVLGAGRLILENLTNLDGLPLHFAVHALPLRIAGGDGSPVRAVASTDESLL